MNMNLDQLRLYVDELEKQGVMLGGIKIADLRVALAKPEGDASALLRAVKVSEFSGISCQDVNGRNWFDARDAYLSGTQPQKEQP